MTRAPLDKLVHLLQGRGCLSMREVLEQLSALHAEVQGCGSELALAGHYRRAFHALRASPRRLQRRMDGVVRLYLVALYAEQLLEPPEADVYFATAYRELYGVVALLRERYGAAWAPFGGSGEELAFFAAVTPTAPLEHQHLAHAFYRRPYQLPKDVLEGLGTPSAAAASQGWPRWPPHTAPEPGAP